MTTAIAARPRERMGRNVILAGKACLWAGVLGAVSGVFLAVVPPSVESDRYSYPLTATGFTVIQVWFFVHHFGLVAGIAGLWHSGAAGKHRRAGYVVSIAGMGMLTAMELLAITAADSAYPSSRTDLLDTGYGVASIAIGIGLVAMGITAVRTGAWDGWRRWLPLSLGVFVFVPMTPAIMAGFLAARLAITAWMLLFALLGWVLVQEAEYRSEWPLESR